MRTLGIETVDHAVQLTYVWLDDLDWRMGWDNKGRSYRLLKSVLQALRDWLPTSKSAQFAARLPTLLRGAYYEHWQPATTPVKRRSKADFLQRIDQAFAGDMQMEPEVATSLVLGFLSTKMSMGDIQDVRQSLPADIRVLWPEPEPAKAA
jgi:uncharacterized protein (DUF2267 family)